MQSFSAKPRSLSSARTALAVAAITAFSTLHTAAVRADTGASAAESDEDHDASRPEPSGGPGWSYLVDGGAIPFAYGSFAAYLGLVFFVSPRDEPLWFSASEGGATNVHETVPSYMVYAGGGVTLVGMAALGGPSRWPHMKGFLQSVATTGLLTELAKDTFGRHRPYYDPATSTADRDRKSFFSGHASLTLAITTYAGLYFQRHVFARWRAPSQRFAWWESFPLAALAGLSVYVPYTRVADNRHHLSDVLAGAAVGAAASVAFFTWQERRFQRTRTAGERHRRNRRGADVVLLPTLDHPGASLLVSF